MQELSKSDESASKVDTSAGGTHFSHLPDTDVYIQKLEARLNKVKGCNKELTSKDMLHVLQKAKDDSMFHLIGSSSGNLSSLSELDTDKEITISYLEETLPRKNGVTFEELQNLLECDILAKATETNGEILNDSNVDR